MKEVIMHLYIMDIRELEQIDRPEELLRSDKRKEKALRFRCREDRLRSVAAGILMETKVPDFFSKELAFSDAGKPYLPGGVPFSLSHGGSFAVLAVSETQDRVGVDVEPLGQKKILAEAVGYVMTPDEAAWAEKFEERLLRIWTRKESLYKCYGTGFRDPRTLPEVLNDWVMAAGKMCFLKTSVDKNYVLSAAVLGNPQGISVHHVTGIV